MTKAVASQSLEKSEQFFLSEPIGEEIVHPDEKPGTENARRESNQRSVW